MVVTKGCIPKAGVQYGLLPAIELVSSDVCRSRLLILQNFAFAYQIGTDELTDSQT